MHTYAFNTKTLTCFQITSKLWNLVFVYHVWKKNILDFFDCNLKKDYQILIIFDTNISDTTCDQMIVQFSVAPIVCFYTTWENKINEILHFYPISPIWVFQVSAKADICLHQKWLKSEWVSE